MDGRRLCLYLTSRPLLNYSILYLFVTFFFATVYWLMPGQFYHSTAMYEPMLKHDEELIKSGLQKALLEQGRRNHGSEILKHHGHDYPLDKFVSARRTASCG